METANMKQPESHRRVYTVKEIAEILGISKNAAYDLVKSNGFVTVRIGKTIRVSIESFDEWLNNC
jgi:excisionase family DNA binding protein